MDRTASSPAGVKLGHVLIAVLPVAAAGALGALATLPNIPTWYSGLPKPPLTPPNGAFGPAWTILYVMMACALWRVLSVPREHEGRRGAIVWFYVQLALNALWSWSFFALHSPAAGAVNIVALIAALLVTVRRFGMIDRPAGWLLLPYLCWVAFAAYLNFGIWWLNS